MVSDRYLLWIAKYAPLRVVRHLALAELTARAIQRRFRK